MTDANTTMQARFCPSCGVENPPNALFCSECGAGLHPEEQEIAQAEGATSYYYTNVLDNSLETTEFEEAASTEFPNLPQVSQDLRTAAYVTRNANNSSERTDASTFDRDAFASDIDGYAGISLPEIDPEDIFRQFDIDAQPYEIGGYSKTSPTAINTRVLQRTRPAIIGAVTAVVVIAVAGVLAFPVKDMLVSNKATDSAATKVTDEESDGSVGTDSQSGSSDFESTTAGDKELSPKNTLEEYSWDNLAKISKEISDAENDYLDVARHYNLIDSNGVIRKNNSKEVRVKLSSGKTVKAHVSIIGFNHDNKADGSGKAGLTLWFDELLEMREMNGNFVKRINSNSGGWAKSSMRREYLEEVLLPGIDKELHDLIVEVEKSTNNVGRSTSPNCVSTTTDKLWLLSATEIRGKFGCYAGATNDILNAEGEQYKLFFDEDIRAPQNKKDNDTLFYDVLRKCKVGKKLTGSSEQKWWYRSPDPTSSEQFFGQYGDSHLFFYGANSVTNDKFKKSGGTKNHFVLPCFCI